MNTTVKAAVLYPTHSATTVIFNEFPHSLLLIQRFSLQLLAIPTGGSFQTLIFIIFTLVTTVRAIQEKR